MNEIRATSPPPSLTAPERHALRGQAHRLEPVVLIGDAGLTEAVTREIDRALAVHELIKIRIAGDDRAARTAIRETLPAQLGCAVVQAIGKTLVLWRPPSEDRPTGEIAAKPRPIRRKLVSLPKKAAGSGKKPELRPRKPRRERPQDLDASAVRGARAPAGGRSGMPGRGPTGVGGSKAPRRAPVAAGTGRPAPGSSTSKTAARGAANAPTRVPRGGGTGSTGGASRTGGFGTMPGGSTGSFGTGRSARSSAKPATGGSKTTGTGRTAGGTGLPGFRKSGASGLSAPSGARPPASGSRQAPATRGAKPAGGRAASSRTRSGGSGKGR